MHILVYVTSSLFYSHKDALEWLQFSSLTNWNSLIFETPENKVSNFSHYSGIVVSQSIILLFLQHNYTDGEHCSPECL